MHAFGRSFGRVPGGGDALVCLKVSISGTGLKTTRSDHYSRFSALFLQRPAGDIILALSSLLTRTTGRSGLTLQHRRSTES